MRMGRKRRFCVAGCLLLFFMAAFPVWAGEPEKDQEPEPVTVIDDASVLMEEEIDWLKEVAADLAADSGWKVVAATCGDAGGKSSREICEEYFVSYAGGGDGISCLIDTDNQKMELVAMGAAEECFSRRSVRGILRKADEAFGKKDYAQCFFLALMEARKAYVQGEQSPLAIAGAALAATLIVVGGVFYFENITKLKKKKENDTEE